MSVALGLSVPPHTPHAISVSLPTWRDNVGYEEGEARVVDTMVTGYPRFFIHLTIRKLAAACEAKYAVAGEQCLLFPTQFIAAACRDFVAGRSAAQPRLVSTADLHVVLFPAHVLPIAKEFWQHTGLGISSRLAEKCLSRLLDDDTPKHGHNRHYSVKGKPTSPLIPQDVPADLLSSDHATYLEERYGRNLPISAAASAKRALRRRVAGTLVVDSSCDESVGPSSRGVANVTEEDVFLFPCGMAAIWNAHRLAREVRPDGKSVCFGFPYTDTLKILQKWGPGAHFFGNGLDEDIETFEALLESESKVDPSKPPVLALFTEFPSNPLLRSANLPRLRVLADKYGFLIVVDETIGNFVNVEVLPYADVVVSSLTKVFSGASNVMGGSLVLNPKGKHYTALRSRLGETYEDTYFGEDAIYMERNSRDFKHRIKVIDENTNAICEFLRSRSVAGGSSSQHIAIKNVFYPKYITRENYDLCRVKKPSSPSPPPSEGEGYGGLFSLTFTSESASKAFFDALPCYKGPSLGTNFTLACPYTILAHFGELVWAEGFGVERGLVRVSVGMEERAVLVAAFGEAVEAAEEVVRVEAGV
ncbi:PLP-dependent transferase [Macrolepiota fuliginosa MF-IS2]|uniref:cystathionine gamma-synthase n=1 Tax=Macrolepiota fuliginosa MF-IS2 TaxID=1400762 RepID=A0A9P5XF46_9AGAR|nr:PLP-dependent transferase [Macrolepiota fuliginosa MF-IS2]